MILLDKEKYYDFPFDKETDLENAISDIEDDLLGNNRIYLDVKKMIGKHGSVRNIPDGYLIDLSSKKEPVLYVVENELAKHDPLKHIAVQILEFSLSFATTPHKVKSIIKQALNDKKGAIQKVNDYIAETDFDNLDHLLEVMIHESPHPFRALVIIDDLSEDLETILGSRFQFPVEILILQRYKSASGNVAYNFEPFMADVSTQKNGTGTISTIDPSDIDTIIIPARSEGFEDVFIGENRWYKIRIHSSMLEKIKYIAAYQVKPISAITHIAEVDSVEKWPDSSKYVVNFKSAAKEVKPIPLSDNGQVKAPQAPRYANYKKLVSANNLDEVFL